MRIRGTTVIRGFGLRVFGLRVFPKALRRVFPCGALEKYMR